ncbi:pantoate--beta-alanine ligase [Asaia lannensis]|uniref:Pantothenate synthetase n=1 Tax=Asaia lannensis NBRC 102526 TaxID=1307926 RepID=A0ABT1CCU0_9PROT|nr:pantoate--beta-alanine ligase [Asaia lannensis]MCO6158682.1 pantoate--beta-alanine ligase [Asaia lannensis NBRC 102526]GBR00473.1 pantoate--beta-alanine ligase [Asaia lannensis NBRC 102526]
MIVRDARTLGQRVEQWQAEGQTIGLVPTMGALHEGHLSLVQEARTRCDRVIVSIFVNPTQFNNPADLASYPRTEEADIALLQGVDTVFIPTAEAMYPAGFSTLVQVSGLSEGLEGAHRPGHFNGMATVVTKLFGLSRADMAFFGEKDWQQLQIVRRLVQDLNLPLEIVPCPTLREADGLALSSRNRRLSPRARQIAPRLHAIMQDVGASIRHGEAIDTALQNGLRQLEETGFGPVDYLACCNARTLQPVSDEEHRDKGSAKDLRLLAAAALDSVRLIDNIVI